MKLNFFECKELLLRGDVVALPTETVFGLAACYQNGPAVQKIFDLKKRPLENPLILHIASPSSVKELTKELPPGTKQLMEAFWPGPLTLILPAKDSVPFLVRAGLPTVAIRMPNHAPTLSLIRETGPLVAPSANLSGRPSSTSAAHVEEDFGKEFPVFEEEGAEKGVESTILIYLDGGWKITRLGALSREEIEAVLKAPVNQLEKSERTFSPGQHFRHYSPKASLHLGSEYRQEAPTVLGFSERSYANAKEVLHFGSLDRPEEALQNLYGLLRLLDQKKVDQAWVDMDFPEEGLWTTLRERLTRAST